MAHNIEQIINESINIVIQEKTTRQRIRNIVESVLKRQLTEKSSKTKSTKRREVEVAYNDERIKKSALAYKVHPNMTKDAARSAFSKEFSKHNKDSRNPSEKTTDKAHNETEKINT